MMTDRTTTTASVTLVLTLVLLLMLGGFSTTPRWAMHPGSNHASDAASMLGYIAASDTLNTLTDAERQAGWQLLFDGATLDGWHRHMDLPGDQVGGQWEVQAGAIVGDQYPPGHGGFLVTDGTYRDFILTLEARLDYPVDSGIFLRVGENGASHQVTLDYRPDGYIGAIYMAYLTGMAYENPDGVKRFKGDGWNELRVQIEGDPARIQCWLNGELITDFQHTEETSEGAPEEGTIGLQVHPGDSYEAGNKVRFRNIQVKPLPSN